MSLQIHSNYLCLPLDKEFLVSAYNDHKGSWDDIQLVQCNETGSSPELSIQCCSFSTCGQYIAVCLSKDLIIYSTNNWKPLCSIKTERKGVSVKFFPKSSVVLLAEKSGHVKFFKFTGSHLEKTDFTLGHNSMLIETLITDDERFLITCDRDEKIRVTNYPNVYNIQCYCLGHTQFVCSIAFLRSDNNVLISSSGDGTIRLWEIETGKELFKYEMCSNKKDSNGNQEYFIKVTSLKIDTDQSLIAALEYKSNCVTILKVTGTVTDSMHIDLFYKIKESAIHWYIEFWQDNLILLLSDKSCPLKLYNWKSNSVKRHKNMEKLSDNISLHWNCLMVTYEKKFQGYSLLYQYKKDNDNFDCIESKKIKCK